MYLIANAQFAIYNFALEFKLQPANYNHGIITFITLALTLEFENHHS